MRHDESRSAAARHRHERHRPVCILRCGLLYSAAEFFAAALREYDWATIVGENTTGKGRSQGNRTLIRSAADYIRAHSAAPLSIDDITQQTNMSKSSLMRQFRIYMGTTPYNYLLSCRITEAKELLSLTDLSVAEIAERVGFGDESSFSSRFSAMTGSSPLQYRRSTIRQNEQSKVQGILPLEKTS